VRIKWFSESRHLVKKRCHVSTLGVEHRRDQTEVPAAFLTLRVAEDLGMQGFGGARGKFFRCILTLFVV